METKIYKLGTFHISWFVVAKFISRGFLKTAPQYQSAMFCWGSGRRLSKVLLTVEKKIVERPSSCIADFGLEKPIASMGIFSYIYYILLIKNQPFI